MVFSIWFGLPSGDLCVVELVLVEELLIGGIVILGGVYEIL